jgi:hypothetical protein
VTTNNNIKVHTRYYINTGDSVPGVTTVLSVLAKPALVIWANKLGLQGIDSNKYKDKMASIGTLAHLMIMCYFRKTTPDLSEFSQQEIDKANNCLKSFYEWEKQHKLEPLVVETPWTSDIYRYGGTPDFVGLIDGQLELVDFKTGSGIYNDYLYQVAAYRQLAIERGHKVERARILRIGRDDNEGFEERQILKFDHEFQLFLHCLSIYNLLKVMKRNL